jgi:hypothetical protein
MKRRAGTMTLTTQREVQTPGVGYFVSKLNFIDSLKQRNDGEDEDDEKDEQKQEGNKSREDENDADFIKVVKSFLQRVPNQEVNDHDDKNKLKKKCQRPDIGSRLAPVNLVRRFLINRGPGG